LVIFFIRNTYEIAMRRDIVLNVHLHQLAYLRETVRWGSLTRAAAALGVSQPALSQALAELERRLGVALFERVGRRRVLTAAGREVDAFARQVLAEADALSQRLAAHRRGQAGTLRVGMIDAASLYVLPEVVRAYRERYPEVDLRVAVEASDELLRRLRARELDLAVVVGPVTEPDLSAVEVAREPLYLYAPPDAEGGPDGAPPWVLYPEGSRTRRIIDAALAEVGIRPRVALESSNPAVLRQMVAIGLGWSVLPAAVAEGTAGGPALRRGACVAERPLCAAWRRASPPDARREAFLRLALLPPGGAGG
jgi:DNA-binding transcriptional LysR family regulator